jgi:hypothetical protein
MPDLYYLIVAAGLCFGLQHKVQRLHGLSTFTDRLLGCAYCVGFHCGWVTWLGWALVEPPLRAVEGRTLISLVFWCFACAWFCYAQDTLLKRLENT